MEEERKQRAGAVNSRKKLENDLKEMESQVEMAAKMKEDSVKQMRRMQNQLKEFQREVRYTNVSDIKCPHLILHISIRTEQLVVKN